MDISMTRDTNRNYIEPMFGFISKVVMVLFCLIWAHLTSALFRRFQFATSNSVIHSMYRLIVVFSCFFESVFSSCPHIISLPLLAFIVSRQANFPEGMTVRGFSPEFQSNKGAHLAYRSATIFASCASVKFVQRFYHLTLGASFRYVVFRHDFLLQRKLCLEPPFASYSLAGGSFILPLHTQLSTNQEKICWV